MIKKNKLRRENFCFDVICGGNIVLIFVLDFYHKPTQINHIANHYTHHSHSTRQREQANPHFDKEIAKKKRPEKIYRKKNSRGYTKMNDLV